MTPTIEWFMRRVEVTEGCWYWRGTMLPTGYGNASWRDDSGKARSLGAHRMAYELFIGSRPAGYELDHLCHTMDLGCRAGEFCLHRRCVNPADLDPVTPQENARRARRQLGDEGYRWRTGPGADGRSFDEHLVDLLRATPVPVAPTGRRGRPRKTHCKRQHPLGPPNLVVRSNGQRACRACEMLKRRGLLDVQVPVLGASTQKNFGLRDNPHDVVTSVVFQ